MKNATFSGGKSFQSVCLPRSIRAQVFITSPSKNTSTVLSPDVMKERLTASA
jgi:hypothetical protein